MSGEQPLLGHDREDLLWDQVEAAPPLRAGSMTNLLREHPSDVLRTLQRSGVQRLGEFCVEVRGVCAMHVHTCLGLGGPPSAFHRLESG